MLSQVMVQAPAPKMGKKWTKPKLGQGDGPNPIQAQLARLLMASGGIGGDSLQMPGEIG